MHPSMFNNLPDPLRILKGCVAAVIVAAAAGFGIGYLVWGK